MKNSHILFVINPKSGGTDKIGLDELIESQCAEHQYSFNILYTKGENDLMFIKEAIQEEMPRTVVACGGDGTINLVAKALLNSNINLGVIPLGSANGLAHEFEIPEDVTESLSIIFNNKVSQLDVVSINGDKISLHLSDVGFNANMIKEFERDKGRGKFGYTKAFFKSILNRESEVYDLYLDGSDMPIQVKAEMLVFANASSYGTGAIINPNCKLDDGLFEIIVFKPIPFTELAGLTFESFFGHIADSPYVEIHQVNKATVKCEKAQLLQIDGELIDELKVIELEIIPAGINFVAP